MKRILLALALLPAACLTAGAAILADFGSAGFTPDYDLSNFDTITQSASGITLAGLDDGQTLAGYFTSTLDFSGVTTLYLTASFDSGAAPDSTFTVLLFNSDFSQTRTYEGAFNAYGAAATSIGLTLVAQDSAFTDIAGFQLIGNGVGNSVVLTLASLGDAVIPEPSAFALFAGAGALVAVVFRRRRQSAKGHNMAAAPEIASPPSRFNFS